jgi:hypothetical protein
VIQLLKFEEEARNIKGGLAIWSKDSNKLLCEEAWRQLHNFTASELLRGNGHINWLLGNERAKHIIKRGLADGIITTKREEKVVEKVSTHAKLTLGDMDVLKNLKAKMEK